MKRKYFLRGLGVGIFVTALLFTVALVLSPPSMSDSRIKKEAKKLGMVEADAKNTPVDELPVEDKDKEVEKKVKETAEEVEKTADAAKSSEAEANKDKQAADEKKTEEDNKKAEAEEKKAEAEEKKKQANEAQSEAERQLEEATKAVQSAAQNNNTLPSEGTDSSSGSGTGSSSGIETGSSSGSGTGSSSGTQTAGQSEKPSGKEVTFVVESGQNSYTVSANLYKAGLVDDASQFDRYLEQHNYDNQVQNGTFSIREGSTYEDIAKTLTRR